MHYLDSFYGLRGVNRLRLAPDGFSSNHDAFLLESVFLYCLSNTLYFPVLGWISYQARNY